jgi:glutamine synthetase
VSERSEAVERLGQAGARMVALAMVDNGGVTRVKTVPLARLDAAAVSGVGMSYVWRVSATDDHFAFVPPFDSPTGDMRLLPDLAAARVLASPGWAWAPVDQCDQELEPLATCQRTLLRRLCERAAAAGIELHAAFETEMTLLEEDGSPAHAGPGYSAPALLPLEPFALALVDGLQAAAMEVEQLHPEYAPGQLEVSVAARDPVTAADEVVLLRSVARQVARSHGLRVSFAPVVLAGEVGNGCHLHLSAWRDGVNLLQGGSEPAGMTSDGAALVAGVLAALPELVALLVPSVPGYHRLRPHVWAGAYACWGVENREAAIRFVPGSAPTRARSANFEVKTVEAAANPYLAAAAIVSAALEGLERGTRLAAPVQGDPGALAAEELRRLGVERLPETLAEATERLAASARARTLLGEELHQAYCAVRRLEWQSYGDWPPEAYRWRF